MWTTVILKEGKKNKVKYSLRGKKWSTIMKYNTQVTFAVLQAQVIFPFLPQYLLIY